MDRRSASNHPGCKAAKLAAAACVTFIATLALVISPLAAQDAPTPEQRTRARELYGQGQQAFAAEDFEASQTAFEAAYREVPNPVVLLGVASAQERRGLSLDAARTLRRYLRERPDAPDRASVEERIAALDPQDATASELTETTLRIASQPPGASIAIDDEPTGRISPSDIQVSPGTHSVVLTLDGYEPLTQAVEAAAGSTTDVALALTAVPAAEETVGEGVEETETADTFGTDGPAVQDEIPAGTDEAPEAATQVDSGPSAGVWVTTGIAGAGLVLGTVFGFLALSAQSDFDAMPNLNSKNEGETFALIADLSFGVALAAGVTAIVLYATERSSSSDDDAASGEYVEEDSSAEAGADLEATGAADATTGDEVAPASEAPVGDEEVVPASDAPATDEQAPASEGADGEATDGSAPPAVSRRQPRPARDLELTLAPWGNARGAGAALGLRF